MGKGTNKFDPKKFYPKLLALVNEKDSIYDLTTAFFNHKDNAFHIVRLWNNAFDNGSVDFRLALVYLANEILHNCKRKDAPVYKDEFKKVLPNALSQLKGTNIVDKVVRVLELWSDRKLVDSAVCSGLIASISSSSGSIEDAKIDPELIKNFAPDAVISGLKDFLIMETDTASKERQLGCILANEAYTTAAVRQLKDRSHGEAYRQQLDESCQRLEDLVRDLERLEERREALLSLLEKAHMFFAAQYSDVSVVVTAYRKYGEMVAFMRRRVEDRLAESPDAAGSESAPAASAIADAPSPTADTADAFGVEVAVLSRREDEMEIDSGADSGGQGVSAQAQQHGGKRRHRKHRRHSGSSGGGGRRDGGGGKSNNRKRPSRLSRSRSRSASSTSDIERSNHSRNSTSGQHHHQHHQHHRHEIATGSDSPPARSAMHHHSTQPQHHHQQPHQHQQHPVRSATPTLDERIGAVSTGRTIPVPAMPASSPPGQLGMINSRQMPIGASSIASWLPQPQAPTWRPPPPQPPPLPLPTSAGTSHTININNSTANSSSNSSSTLTPTMQSGASPIRPPPLPPPPPFFPAFRPQHQPLAGQQYLQQQQQQPPVPQSIFSGPYQHPGPGAVHHQQQPLPRPPPMFDSGGGLNRWRPVDGGFSQ